MPLDPAGSSLPHVAQRAPEAIPVHYAPMRVDEIAELVLGLGRVVDRLGHVLAQLGAEPLAHAMEGDPDGGLRHAQLQAELRGREDRRRSTR